MLVHYPLKVADIYGFVPDSYRRGLKCFAREVQGEGGGRRGGKGVHENATNIFKRRPAVEFIAMDLIVSNLIKIKNLNYFNFFFIALFYQNYIF